MSGPLFRPSQAKRFARLDLLLTSLSHGGLLAVVFTCIISGTNLGTGASSTGYIWFFIVTAEVVAIFVAYLLLTRHINRLRKQYSQDYEAFKRNRRS